MRLKVHESVLTKSNVLVYIDVGHGLFFGVKTVEGKLLTSLWFVYGRNTKDMSNVLTLGQLGEKKHSTGQSP